MRFSDPNWLLAGLLICIVLIAMWRRHDVRQQTALSDFVAPHLRQRLTNSVSRVGRFVQRGLLLASVLCLCAALAGPEYGYHWEQISRRGNEVVFAIDTSRSMLTPDVKPNRLTRAKLAINDMARQLDGDGIGIVAFAGSAFLVCPLTLDYGAFQQSLDAVDVHTIPQGGTNISSAILTARAALRRRPGSDRILILVTDGENLEGNTLTAAEEAAKQDGLKIYTVGIGTAEGDLIPLPSDLGGNFVKDDTGALVKSHLDEAGLNAIASATGGTYVHLGGPGEDFDAFLKTVFGAVSKHDLLYRQQKIYTQRYQWPLTAALVMLLANLMVGTRRSGRRKAAAASQSVAVLAVIGALVVPVRSESADQTSGPGGTADARTPLMQYNLGTSAYRAGRFPQATQAFQKSIEAAPASDAKRLSDQEDAYYNLGNTLYRGGQQLEKTDPRAAIQKWTDAVKAYETALQLRGDDPDSKYNRDFVKRKIDALRQPPDQGGGGGGGGGGAGQGGGDGQGGGQGQYQPDSHGQGQPPPQAQPPPQGQPPRSPPQNSGNDSASPPPGQPAAPPNAPAPKGDRPSPATSQSAARPAPSTSTPADQGNGDEKHPAENQRAPGQMSVAEARELLDSAKSDEHHSLLAPSGPRPPDSSPDKAIKNW
jgi:Ca-activated chloride channel family protein